MEEAKRLGYYCYILGLNITTLQNEHHEKVGIVGASWFMPLYGIVTAIGAMTNLMLFMQYPKTDFNRSFRNCMVLHLSFCDLGLLLIGSPTSTWLQLDLYWPFSELGCKFSIFAYPTLLMASSLTIALITMNRFMLTHAPKWLVAQPPFACVVLIWLLSASLCSPYAIATSLVDFVSLHPYLWRLQDVGAEVCNFSGPFVCIQPNWHDMWLRQDVFNLSVVAIQNALPLLALLHTGCSLGSSEILNGSGPSIRLQAPPRASQRKIERKREYSRNSFIMAVIITLSHILPWLPQSIGICLHFLGITHLNNRKRTFYRLVGLTSTGIRPIIYFFVNDRIRRGFLGQFLPFYTPPASPATPSSLPSSRPLIRFCNEPATPSSPFEFTTTSRPFIRFSDDPPVSSRGRRNSRKLKLLRTINRRLCRHRLAPLATIDEFNELSEDDVV